MGFWDDPERDEKTKRERKRYRDRQRRAGHVGPKTGKVAKRWLAWEPLGMRTMNEAGARRAAKSGVAVRDFMTGPMAERYRKDVGRSRAYKPKDDPLYGQRRAAESFKVGMRPWFYALTKIVGSLYRGPCPCA